MSTVFAHIGSEKCGSSLIEFCFLNNPSILEYMEQQGIIGLPHFHVALRKVVVGTQWDEALHGRLRSQMLSPHRFTGKNVFISEELLLGLMHEPGVPNPLDLRIDFTQRLLRGFEKVHLILIVRRQDKFIESHYNQQVMRGETREFNEVLDELPLDNYCWDVIADAWAEGFGEGSLTVIPFEPSVLATASGPENTVSAVAQIMGMNLHFDTKDLPVVNPSLRPDLLAAQREINQKFDRVTADRISDILAKRVRKVPGAAQGLFSDQDRQHILGRYAESNKRLFEKYIPQYSVDEYLSITHGS